MAARTGVKGGGRATRFVYRARFSPSATEIRELVSEAERILSGMQGSAADVYSLLKAGGERIVPLTNRRYLVVSEEHIAVKQGYIAPSMFIAYRRCARMLAIEIMKAEEIGGVVATADELRSYAKGIITHRLYYERYAVGETEYKVVSEKHRILGYIDEVRREGDRHVIVEVKSSYSPDLVAVALQVMSYMLAYSEQEGVPMEAIEGYVLTPGGTYRVVFASDMYWEYYRRLRVVVENAVAKKEDMLPPRLSGRLSSRCVTCPYRGECARLPDRFRTYERFFEAMGFTRLAPRRSGRDLLGFLGGGK